MPTISLRFDLEGGRLGPGKVLLLERIAREGSIAAAGRSLGMSYRRAWLLVSELNALFARPLVENQRGGRSGGGAALTDLGSSVVARYREAERATLEIARPHLDALQRDVAEVSRKRDEP